MFIDGFGFTAFRSFGEELQLFGPCNKVNIIIGQNNSGKSNVLRFLVNFLGEFYSGKPFKYTGLDSHLGKNLGRPQIALGLKLDGLLFDELIKLNGFQIDSRGKHLELLKRVLSFDELTLGTDASWFVYERADNSWNASMKAVEKIAEQRLTQDSSNKEGLTVWMWQELFRALPGVRTLAYNNSRALQEALPMFLQKFSPKIKSLPPVALIRAIREVKSDESKKTFDYSGINIVQELARLERPDVVAGQEYRDSKRKFELINRFLVEVTGNKNMRLEVPASQKTIQVHEGEIVLPLEHLGTGIHEVIILAIAATSLEEQIICIEEPEIHLHPVLQKKLLRYLNEATSNQYFITTHSAAMIDLPGAAIFHIRHDGEQSRVKRVTSAGDLFEVTSDLGYRASDLLQTNCIIWVEGPTDRLYLRHWLKSFDPDLEEGVHYSLMFYGGRLLNHLSADDEEVDDFIALRRINRNLAILIDSDKRYRSAKINETKKRVREEFNKGPGFAWVTSGREIENYIPEQLMLRSLKKLYPSVSIDRLSSTDQYHCRYHFMTSDGKEVTNVDKVKLAREIVSEEADLSMLDLQKQVALMAEFIRKCNDLFAEEELLQGG